jgi:hypothetical protein
MQIKLKKYFMIIRSATVKAAPVGKRERKHLDPSREIPTRKHAGKPTICVRNSLKHSALFQCPPEWRTDF